MPRRRGRGEGGGGEDISRGRVSVDRWFSDDVRVELDLLRA